MAFRASGARSRESSFHAAALGIAALAGVLVSGCGAGVATGTWQAIEVLDTDSNPDTTFFITKARSPVTGDPVQCLNVEVCEFNVDNTGVPNGGKVRGEFVLDDSKKDPGRQTKVFVALRKDGTKNWSSRRPALDCGTGKAGNFTAAGGPQTFCFDSSGFGETGSEKVEVRVCPQYGDDNDCKDFICTIDNRGPPPPAEVLECKENNGIISIRYSFPEGTSVVEKSISEEAIYSNGVCNDEFSTQLDQVQIPGRITYTTEWNSNVCFPEESEVTCPRVKFSFEKARDAYYSFGQCFRVNNSVPRAVINRVDSHPRVTDPSSALGGQIIVDYEIEDLGEETCKIEVEATLTSKDLTKSITLNTRLDVDSELRLTEALGGEKRDRGRSEGTTGLPTSERGVDHTFIWNSDYDIDRLRRLGRIKDLSQPVDVRLVISVEDEKGESLKSDALPALFRLDNRSVHTISGVLPGQTDRGTDSVSVRDLSFEEISDVEIFETVLYIVDPATNVVWEGLFDAKVQSLRRIAGNGGRRAQRDAPSGPADELALLEPIDLEVLSDTKVLLLERAGGNLLSIENQGGQRVIVPLIQEGELLDPLALVVDSSGRFAYIADTGNCRILKYDIQEKTTKVIFGQLTSVDPTDDAKIGSQYPQLNGCNYTVTKDNDTDNDGKVDLVDCRPTFREAPVGLVYIAPENCGEREYLLFTQPLREPVEEDTELGEIRYLDLASGAVSLGIVQREKGCPTYPGGMNPLSVFTRPKAIELIIENEASGPVPYLYFVSDGINHSGAGVSRSILMRGVLNSENCDSLKLENTEPVAGRLISLTEAEEERFRCGCSDNSDATYRQEQECLPALAAPVATISSVALGTDDRVYFADRYNQRIRFVDSACKKVEPERDCLGLAAPLSGTSGLRTFLGGTVQRDPDDDLNEEVVLGFDSLQDKVIDGKLVSSGEGVPSDRLRKLSEPTGLVFLDNTNILFTETGSNRIQRLDLETLLLTTVAGTDSKEKCPEFSGDNGLATSAVLSGPAGIAIYPSFKRRSDAEKGDTSDFWEDSKRRVYFCDRSNNRVRMIDAEGKISTLVGSGIAFSGTNCCRTNEEPAENALPCTPVCDSKDPTMLKSLTCEGKPGNQVFLNRPESVVTDMIGRVFIADQLHRILKVEDPDSADRLVYHVAGNPCVREYIQNAPAKEGLRLTDPNEEFSQTKFPATKEETKEVPALAVYLGQPGEMAFDQDYEFLYYADTERGLIRRLEYDIDSGEFGSVVPVAGNGESRDTLDIEASFCGKARSLGFGTPYGLALDDGLDPPVLYFATRAPSRLYRLELGSALAENEVEQLTGFEGSGSVGDGQGIRQAALQSPRHIEVDREGNVFFADERNHRLRRFTPGKKNCAP